MSFISADYISAEEARNLLVNVSSETGLKYLSSRLGGENKFECELIFVNHLVAKCDFVALKDFLSSYDAETVKRLVNETSYFTHFGNTLSTCAYWNTGDNCLKMFEYLISLGALPIYNYYKVLPWENESGAVYVTLLGGRTIGLRNSSEFESTYSILKEKYCSLAPSKE